MHQIIQLAGALLILAPFMAAQFGRLQVTSATYLMLNLAGSTTLTGVALVAQDWGFLLLEIVWAVVSAFGLYRVLRGRTPVAAH